MRALIVDNNEFARARLKEALEHIGFEVVGEADDGLDAIEGYRNLKPDIVTMCVTMPEMDGIETTKKIKEEDPDATILMVTALASSDILMSEALEAGVLDYLGKPFTVDELNKAIEGIKPRKPKRL